ncbi:hypothetical protein QBC38DRAFT_480835 [Podospora fimiseda]|uniref:Uncharacterized protein n=1 Tax=Podospora fimiseda TaxID=252190 RepID=A0AAN7BMW1_9PEZI|nr:hypothetical protein QBC38DRAFT_480835 [Podospora fimiseda]
MPCVVYTSNSSLDDLEDAEIVVRPDPSLVELPKGTTKRLYATTMLYKTLENATVQIQKKTPSDVDDTTDWSDEKTIFRRFVNRLAHICDSLPHGRTVTALAILAPGCIEYRLTSNERRPAEYDEVKQYLSEQILGILRDTPDNALNNKTRVSALTSTLLLNVLRFTRKRIKCYVNLLVKPENIDFCIQWCKTNGDAEFIPATRALYSLQQIGKQTISHWSNPEQFAKSTFHLLTSIKTHKPALSSLLRLKSTAIDNSSSPSPWTDIHHAIGRLDSYSIAIKALLDARKRWPMLFASYEVTSVPSRPRHPNPITLKQSACNAKHILSSLNSVSDPKIISACEKFAGQFALHSVLSLDDCLRQEIKDPGYNTLVHAETNLLDSIYRSHLNPDPESGALPDRFFEEAKFGRYIGASKQTCMLCNLYFEAYEFKCERRDSHGTLYVKWRPPDVFKGEPRELEDKRKEAVYRMAAEMKKIVGQGILARSGSGGGGGRRWDSRHETSDALRTVGSLSLRGSVQGDDGMSEMEYLMAQVGSSTAATMRGGNGSRELRMGMEKMSIGRGSENKTVLEGFGEEDSGFSDGEDDVDGGAKL